MSKKILSEGAKQARRKYYRDYYKSNPERHRIYICRSWEKKARALYDKEYIPPKKDGELSAQAREVRNRYYAERHKKKTHKEYMKAYRATHKEQIAKYNHDYWERKAAAV